MIKEDNPAYFNHVCEVVKAVFAAENELVDSENIKERLQRKEITPEEYIELVAAELIRPTRKEDIDDGE